MTETRRRTRDDPPPIPSLADFLDKSPGVTVHCPSCLRAVGLTFRVAVQLAGRDETIDGLKRRLRCVECGTRGAGAAIAWCWPGWGRPTAAGTPASSPGAHR